MLRISKSIPEKTTTWVQVIGSVLAAFFGVQSSKNQERDFAKGSPIRFILMGLVMGGLFIGTIILIVKVVLP